MRIILTFKNLHHRTKTVEIVANHISLDDMKKLWEAERTINSLMMVNTKVHVEVLEK
jgi:hypothetical protein